MLRKKIVRHRERDPKYNDSHRPESLTPWTAKAFADP